MNCNAVQDVIAPYVDQELSDETQLTVNAHLESCDLCRTELKAHLGAHRLLKEKLEKTPASQDFRKQLESRIFEDESRITSWIMKKNSFSMRPITAFAVAASIVLIIMFSNELNTFLGRSDLSDPVALVSQSTQDWTDGIAVTVVGEVVCVGCYLRENFAANQDCDKYGHIMGFLTDEGNLWTFTRNPESESLIAIEEVTGKKMKIEGKLYYNAHYIDVDKYSLVQN